MFYDYLPLFMIVAALAVVCILLNAESWLPRKILNWFK